MTEGTGQDGGCFEVTADCLVRRVTGGKQLHIDGICPDIFTQSLVINVQLLYNNCLCICWNGSTKRRSSMVCLVLCYRWQLESACIHTDFCKRKRLCVVCIAWWCRIALVFAGASVPFACCGTVWADHSQLFIPAVCVVRGAEKVMVGARKF